MGKRDDREREETDMSTFYELVGRLVVGFVMRRYGTQIRVAGAVGVGLAAAALAAYVATRDGDEDA
jgi:hypothetical protein